MAKPPILAVFSGGTSSERDVSLGSGLACALAASRHLPTRLFIVDTNALPAGFDPAVHVVFSTLHGTFGEDGGMQALLERAGASFTGCSAAASALLMDKARTKATVAARGGRVAEGIVFEAADRPAAEEVVARLGTASLVVKPNDEGSSVGLSLVSSPGELAGVLAGLKAGRWLVERRILGRELSVGLLGGRALGVVEIRPKSGLYDYASKYTRGATEYLSPAPLEPATTALVRRAAEAAFEACGCRDYARADFILDGSGEPFLLEINTLPGMKETSLLPKSALCEGLDFASLVGQMVAPALRRFVSGRG